VPKELRENIVFSIGSNYTGSNDFKYEAYTPEVYGKRITLSWVPASSEDEKIINKYGGIFKTPAYLVQMKPQLKIDGDVVAEGKAVGLGNTQEFRMTMKPVGLSQEDVINTVTVGGFYCVGLDYGIVSPKELQKIAQNIESLKNTISIDNIYTDEAMGEILNAVSKAYFAQLNIYDLFLETKYNVASTKLLSEAITGYDVKVKHMFMNPVEVNEGSMYIDVDRNVQSVISVNGDKQSEKAYMMLFGQIASTMEHGIFEQMIGIPSVSTIKVLHEANERGIPIYTVTRENINPKRYDKKEAGGALRYVKNIEYNSETGECINTKRIPYLDIDKVIEDEKYDGYYAIITSEVDMPDHEVVKAYHGLWEIEHSFRITKSDLESRPVHVSLEQRIEAHFLTCFIALLILRLLNKRLNGKHSPEQIIQSLRKYQVCFVKDNVFKTTYYDHILKDLGDALNLTLNRRYLKTGEIKQLVADSKKET
jgi:hypothetical protein